MSADSLESRLDAYFENRLTAVERLTLENELRDSPAIRELFWQRARWHHTLKTWGGQRAGQAESGLRPLTTPTRSSQPRWLAWSAGLAAALIIGFWLIRPTIPMSVATLSFAEKAIWAESPPLNGSTMRPGDYHLTRGMIRFETKAGAVVSISAPARFKFTAADRLNLLNGKLTARMLGKDSNLTVTVDDMEVRDLGTAFGIDANGRKHTLVSVFDGIVAVTNLTTGRDSLTVTEGQSVIDNRGDSLAARAEYAPDGFKDLWPLTVGINDATRLVEFLPPGPLIQPLREYRANDRLFLFPENQNSVTDRALMVDVSPAVPNWPDAKVSPYPIPAGQRASSYLLFFQPDVSTPGNIRHLSGEITFQHQVLGVICSDQGLDASDPSLGIAKIDYSTPGQRRGLEEADKINYRSTHLPHDSIRISPDGRTVQFDFYVADEREQMRVIVAPR